MITDLDECSLPGYNCAGHGKCNNVIGTYSCTCDSGYVVNTAAEPNTCEGKCWFAKTAPCDFFLIQTQYVCNPKSGFLTKNIVVRYPSENGNRYV